MRKITLLLGAASAIAVAGTSNAGIADYDYIPYMGADYKYSRVKGKGDWRKILKENKHSGNFHVGSIFHHVVGAELGYTNSYSSKQTVDFSAADEIFNGTPGAGRLNTKFKLSSLDMDVNGYFPVASDCINLVATAGMAYTHLKFSATANTGGVFYDAMTQTESRRKFVGRVGFGIEYLWQNFSFRLRGMFENTARLRVKNIRQLGFDIHENALKNSFAVVGGLNYHFA